MIQRRNCRDRYLPRRASCHVEKKSRNGRRLRILATAFALGHLACSGAGQATKTDAASAGTGGTGGNTTAGSTAGGTGGQSSGGAPGGGGAGSGGLATGGADKVDAAAGGQGTGGLSTGNGGAGSGGAGNSGVGNGGAGSGGADGKGGATGGATTTSIGKGGSSSPTSTGGSSTSSCGEPPAASPLVGWASVAGAGNGGTSVPTTTGGGTATPVTVSTLADLIAAAKASAPAVIYVKGVLAAGTVKVASNKTIAGVCGAEIHGHISISGSSNVIIRNVKIVGYNCSDSPGECKSGADAVTVVDGAHHIWFDHDDISDGSDGNLDITNGSDLVTVSWTKFHYSSKRTDPVTGSTGHRFSNLIGAADGLAEDVGHLNVTWHHNWWADNIAERMPRSRDGKIHVVNNLFTASGNDYCTNSGNLSSLLVENNVYIGVGNPLQEDDDGNMLARGNVFQSTSGSKTSKGAGFTPPYALPPDDTANLEATIRSQAGPH
jgi:pectate lyase